MKVRITPGDHPQEQLVKHLQQLLVKQVQI